jgi:hypothetical protein
MTEEKSIHGEMVMAHVWETVQLKTAVNLASFRWRKK